MFSIFSAAPLFYSQSLSGSEEKENGDDNEDVH
jgi:hypothetical protein